MVDNKDISVLIVDDNDITRETLRVILRHEVYTVAGEAYDGESALEMAIRLRPDIILLDVVMPKVSGLEALKNIRMVMADVKVLMVSANQDQEVVVEANNLGVSGYIVKPFNAKKVLDTMQQLASQVRVERKSGREAATAKVNQAASQ